MSIKIFKKKIHNIIRNAIWMVIGFCAIMFKTIIQWLPLYSVCLFGALALWYLTGYTGVRELSSIPFHTYMAITMAIPNMFLIAKAWLEFDYLVKH